MIEITFDQLNAGPVTPFFHTAGAPASKPLRGNRAFFGLAKNHGQQVDGQVTGGSWLQKFNYNAGGVLKETEGWDYFEDMGRVVSVSDFGTALSGVSRTGGGGDAIGVVGAAVNDYVPIGGQTHKFAWAGYFDAIKSQPGAGNVVTVEMEAANLPGPSPLGGMTPYRGYVQGMVNNLLVGAGSDVVVFGRSYAIDSMINIGNNGAAAWTGINFRFDAIMRAGVADNTTSPGNTGYARAISLAKDQGISWYSQNPYPGQPGTQGEVLQIYAGINNPDHRAAFMFDDSGMQYRERDLAGGGGHPIFKAEYAPNVNGALHVIPSKTDSNFVQIGVLSETGGNRNLMLRALGTGRIAFGEFVAAAGGVPAHIPVISYDGVTRRLAVV